MNILLPAVLLFCAGTSSAQPAPDPKDLIAGMKALADSFKPAPVDPGTVRKLIDILGGDQALEMGGATESRGTTPAGGPDVISLMGHPDFESGEDLVNRPVLEVRTQECAKPSGGRMVCVQWDLRITMKCEIDLVRRAEVHYDLLSAGGPAVDMKASKFETLKPKDDASLKRWAELEPRLKKLPPSVPDSTWT
jgi:hypothetical protein